MGTLEFPDGLESIGAGAVSYTHLDVYKRQGEIRPILILCRNLKVIGRLCLPIVHGIFLEAHEGRIGISLGVTVSLAQYIQ